MNPMKATTTKTTVIGNKMDSVQCKMQDNNYERKTDINHESGITNRKQLMVSNGQ